MKNWLKKVIIGDDFYQVFNDISMLDHEVRKVRKEIVDLRNEILFELIENKSLLKQILEQRKIITDIKNNIEVVKVEEEKSVIKRELPDIPDKEVKIVKSILTQEDVKELFEYRDGDLYWKIDIYSGNQYVDFIKIKAGTKAGALSFNKKLNKYFKVVGYQKKSYVIARLIFLMFKGYLPEKITYKDGNSLNTRIENLIEANASQVQVRSKLAINNKTGYKGVSFCNTKNKYIVTIRVYKRNLHLGYYDKPEEGFKAFEEAKTKYYGTYLNKFEVSNG